MGMKYIRLSLMLVLIITIIAQFFLSPTWPVSYANGELIVNYWFGGQLATLAVIFFAGEFRVA